YRSHRRAAAALLKTPAAYLWSDVLEDPRSASTSKAELVTLYPYRSAMPSSLWWEMLGRDAQKEDILVYAANFLHEQLPDMNDALQVRAEAGCKVRVALGDPDSPAVRARGEEEKFGHGIETRCRVALMHYQLVINTPGIDVHLHRTTLYNSIYRFDDEMLVNTHVWGVNAYNAPVMHLRRLVGGSLFDTYAASFEAVWAT